MGIFVNGFLFDGSLEVAFKSSDTVLIEDFITPDGVRINPAYIGSYDEAIEFINSIAYDLEGATYISPEFYAGRDCKRVEVYSSTNKDVDGNFVPLDSSNAELFFDTKATVHICDLGDFYVYGVSDLVVNKF